MKPKTPAGPGAATVASTPAAVKTPRPAKPRDPAVVAAEAALAAAKAKAKSERVATQKPKAEPRPTCTATKHDGAPCTAKAKQGQVTCVDHTPAWERLTTEEQVAFGAWMVGQSKGELANYLGWHAVKALLAGGGARG